jgi:hypothetical protein
MTMVITPPGVVKQLNLIGTVPGKTTLTGTVRRRRGGTGRAILPTIGGSSGARIHLKTPPFYFTAATPIDAKTPAARAMKALPHARTALLLSRRRARH